jgi:hypothetical protein
MAIRSAIPLGAEQVVAIDCLADRLSMAGAAADRICRRPFPQDMSVLPLDCSALHLAIDMCVLATVMAAVDLGFRIVLPSDALCSARDKTHLMTLYRERLTNQVKPPRQSGFCVNDRLKTQEHSIRCKPWLGPSWTSCNEVPSLVAPPNPRLPKELRSV